MRDWQENINTFIELSNKHGVRMILVGGAAVQFHGYNRNSLDVDFWLDATEANFKSLKKAFKEMGYELDDFPNAVKEKQQNISVKFSPMDVDLELITNFSVNKSFDEAYSDSETFMIDGNKTRRYNVLSLEDLILSKIKAGRLKDLLDIQELKRINDKSE